MMLIQYTKICLQYSLLRILKIISLLAIIKNSNLYVKKIITCEILPPTEKLSSAWAEAHLAVTVLTSK